MNMRAITGGLNKTIVSVHRKITRVRIYEQISIYDKKFATNIIINIVYLNYIGNYGKFQQSKMRIH